MARDDGTVLAQGERLKQLVAEVDTGGREPAGATAKTIFAASLLWTLFQLYYASPLPFVFNLLILNDTEARSVHLGFALFLAFTAFPAFKRSPRERVPAADWIFAVLGAFAGGYLFLFYRDLAARPGLPTTADLAAAACGTVLLLEAARRTLGPALCIIALAAIGYVFAGPFLPGMISHKGASLSRAASQFWLTTEGVFGVALGVSTSFVFLFVLFGTLLEKAGAGNYFIKLSFALLGHLRGGPAKAGVVSSGLMGMISGSSVANVVTCGTLTIPLMKRVGYSPAKAGAIECAAGVNGQIMPPVMGAAAFLIAEYVGISYAEVVKHAFLPAIITYLALFYIVDIEAVKLGIKGLPRTRRRSRIQAAATGLMTAAGFVIVCGAVYFGLGWTKEAFGAATKWIAVAACVAAYLGLVAYRARFPDLELDDPGLATTQLPDFATVARTGLHFLLPIFVLVWCLMIEALSPGLSAFYGTMTLIAIVLTQRPLTAVMRGEADWAAKWRQGAAELIDAFALGARNMIPIGVATAAAGIVVGTVTLTGVGLVLTEVVEFLSGGNLIVVLLLTAAICLVLGMGMPTTASYIVVATLMAPIIVELAAQHDLAVPLVAVHLFVFYFGLMADVTPPVALAAFAASAISGAGPVATGAQAFRYEIRTGLLPFVFLFNTELLMIGVEGVFEFALIVLGSLLAMLMFAAATQAYFLTRCRWYEIAALLLVSFSLFRPGYWWDMVYPPFVSQPPAQVFDAAGKAETAVRIRVSGESLVGNEITKLIELPLPAGIDGRDRLRRAGVMLRPDGDKMAVDNVAFGSAAKRAGLDAGWTIDAVVVPSARPGKHWVFVPALGLLGGVVLLQLSRRRRPPALAAG